jgi:hypothetical protein
MKCKKCGGCATCGSCRCIAIRGKTICQCCHEIMQRSIAAEPDKPEAERDVIFYCKNCQRKSILTKENGIWTNKILAEGKDDMRHQPFAVYYKI